MGQSIAAHAQSIGNAGRRISSEDIIRNSSETVNRNSREDRSGTRPRRENAATEGGGAQYSIDKYCERQIDKWDGKDHGGAFRVGSV